MTLRQLLHFNIKHFQMVHMMVETCIIFKILFMSEHHQQMTCNFKTIFALAQMSLSIQMLPRHYSTPQKYKVSYNCYRKRTTHLSFAASPAPVSHTCTNQVETSVGALKNSKFHCNEQEVSNLERGYCLFEYSVPSQISTQIQ